MASPAEVPELLILPTGVANEASIHAALKRVLPVGSPAVARAASPAQLLAARAVIVPGVGTFGSAMDAIVRADLKAALIERVRADLPTFFVCVGLQLLAAVSEESPGAAGLGVISAVARRFPPTVTTPQQQWARVEATAGCRLLAPSSSTPRFFYFSNSYFLDAVPLGWAALTACHGGVTYVAALERGRVVACQFHPELSGAAGQALLTRWLTSAGVATALSLALAASAFSPAVSAFSTAVLRPFIITPAALPAAAPPASTATVRVIPCLDVRGGRVAKGIKFAELRDAGDPGELAAMYEAQGADELVMLDISATPEERSTALETVRAIRARCCLPLTVGGGVKSLETAAALLLAGADKVAVNTAGVERPALLSELAAKFGSQACVLAIDAKRKVGSSPLSWVVMTHSGATDTGIDAVAWAKQAAAAGVGEILLTSFDRDGTKAGFDTELVAAVSAAVNVPVIASGGASNAAHMAAAVTAGASAVLAASILHFGETTVGGLKDGLAALGVPIRPSVSSAPSSANAAADAPAVKAPSRRPRPLTQCMIPSIDLMNGHAVQLVGGDPQKLEVDAGDPIAIAKRFSVLGEVAVVDLDAALGRPTNNAAVMRDLLRIVPCRVGGGIRTVQAALDWLNAGAAKVVIGTAASPDFLQALPRDRVVVALDQRSGKVVVDGWKTTTKDSVADRMVALVPYAGHFLVTFVEREGRMGGVDVPAIKALVAALADAADAAGVSRAVLTIAGGVTTPTDLRELHALGVEAQVGMALYTGRLGLSDGILSQLQGTDRPDGLYVTAVVSPRRMLLGVCYSSLETIHEAVETGKGVYHSRTRGRWLKGETSGAVQTLLGVEVDCDGDAVSFIVDQEGEGFCHRNTFSCFSSPASVTLGGLPQLEETLQSRLLDAPPGSYTRKLFESTSLLRAKLVEEAAELAAAAESRDANATAHEAADVFYFALVACARAGASLKDVERILDLRARRVTRREGAAKVVLPASPHLQALAGGAGAAPVAPPALPSSVLRRVGVADVMAQLKAGTLRPRAVDDEARTVAKGILDEVRTRGTLGLVEIALRFGDLPTAASPLLFTRQRMREAYESLPVLDQEVLVRTAARIRAFAVTQRSSFQSSRMRIPGGQAGHTMAAVERAGCYAPGGRYPLPSSVLMTVIPARVAGCRFVIVASPHPAVVTLAAAWVAEADFLLTVGGAQAVGALTYGLTNVRDDEGVLHIIPPVDIVVGPGNRFVTAAKSLVAGLVAIDMLAGPSELLVLADGAASPEVVAADLLAQAEHDPSAVPMLVVACSQADGGREGGEAFARRVDACLTDQLAVLSTADIARASITKNGFAAVADSLDAAIELADALAAEHLEVHTRMADDVGARLQHYGALFIGSRAAEVLGDYGAGPNHTLPTGGTARSFGGLSVLTFLRARTWLRMDDPPVSVLPGGVRAPADVLVQDCVRLAEMEGLYGHAASASWRLSPLARADATGLTIVNAPSALDARLIVDLFSATPLRLAVPKGRMYNKLSALLDSSGLRLELRSERDLRPLMPSMPKWDVKLLKPRNVVEALHAGARDVGFVGIDLIAELDASVEAVFDTGMDAVRIVCAAPEGLLSADGKLSQERHYLIATEYENLTRRWILSKKMNATVMKTYGSTEVFVPDDADLIVDNMSTGTTLRENRLSVVETIFRSSTHLCCHPSVLQEPVKRFAIDQMAMLLKSSLDARNLNMLEFNIASALLPGLADSLPALRSPTISPLQSGNAVAVKVAVMRHSLASVVATIKQHGGTDLLVTAVSQTIA
jgi:ATP phosphoribosyltransferase/imidazole glycerol phosphate synthase glutamine amidotransferase subunit